MEPQGFSTPPNIHFDLNENETPTIPPGKDYKLKMVNLNGVEIAAFNIDGEDLLCFPQVYDYFLKDMVSGMHTVYTKLKRMGIQGKNCNVEQVRMMRSVGAIGQVVNRCKLISAEDFNRLYEDCLLYRGPGRRKKNPDFPPELLNSPFKHFKVESRTDNQLAGEPANPASNASRHLVKPAIGLLPSNHSKTMFTNEESRDANNNNASNGEIFKVTISQQANGALPNPIQTTFVSRMPAQHALNTSGAPPSRIMSPLSTSSAGNSFPPPANQVQAVPSSRPSFPISPHGITASPRSTLAPTMISMTGAATSVTHSPLRSPTGEGGTSESSVHHVTSSGAAEHAEFRGTGNDTGSEVSVSSPRLPTREMEYPRDAGSVETLLLNIQGLLRIAAENARQQERQAHYEKEELRRQILKERDAREKVERQWAAMQRGKAFVQKKLKREKRAKRKLAEQLQDEHQRGASLEQQLKNSSQETLKLLNESLAQELERERAAKLEAERKLKEARGEIQNFVQNFLDPSQAGGQQQPPTEHAHERQSQILDQPSSEFVERNIKEEHMIVS